MNARKISEFWNTILVRLHAECAALYEMEVRRRRKAMVAAL
jgi:hypothetical protein